MRFSKVSEHFRRVRKLLKPAVRGPIPVYRREKTLKNTPVVTDLDYSLSRIMPVVILYVIRFALQVLGLMKEREVGRLAADGFYIIVADFDEVMNVKMHANCRVSLSWT